MKKIIVLVIAIIALCALSVAALAASCPDHPNAKVNTTISSGYEQHSVVKHKRLATDSCATCGKSLGNRYVFDWHNYSGNVCKDCGYVKPAKDQLNRDAILLGDKVVDRELWVLYQAAICDDVNGGQITLAQPNEQYYILAYQNVGNNIWIQVRKTTGDDALGWMKAENVAISERPDPVPDGLVGRTFRITTSSGRGRTGAGTENAYIETVHYGETYTILDVDYASNGVAWFKIKVSGTECWVSSGLGSWQ
ncbi:MAG: hypothetical protein II879_05425 [Clostridia bacterium]|nr:hypothetical protein [Clostridia bacterium]